MAGEPDVTVESDRESAILHSVRVSVEVSDTMLTGHLSLPNGMGLGYPRGEHGDELLTGVPPNELTAAEDRDPFVGTPWHKHVRARVERVPS